MEEKRCSRCDRSETRVRLIDVIDNFEIVKACEECLVTENLPIIRSASTEQLRQADRQQSVGERLSRMTGVSIREAKRQEITLDVLRKPKDYKSVLEKKFSQAKEKNQPLNLVDNYHWHIAMERKNKKISRKQLADAVGVSEEAIKMIENRELVDDALILIRKIEQYLGISLRNTSLQDLGIAKAVVENKLVSEEENLVIYPKKENPAVVLKFDKKLAGNITIDDLRRIKQERDRLKQEVKAEDKKADIKNSLDRSLGCSEKRNFSDIARLVWNPKRKIEEKS